MANATIENSALAAEPLAVEDALPELPRSQQALMLVKSYVPWSAAVGLLPMPLIDTAALFAVQLRMLAKLSGLYGVPFMENGVKNLVTSLLTPVVSTNVGAGLASLIKIVPVVGPLASIAAVPGIYSAATYAVGRVFVTHFEAGGTFLDFDPEKTRAYFTAEFEKAKAHPEVAKAA